MSPAITCHGVQMMSFLDHIYSILYMYIFGTQVDLLMKTCNVCDRVLYLYVYVPVFQSVNVHFCGETHICTVCVCVCVCVCERERERESMFENWRECILCACVCNDKHS